MSDLYYSLDDARTELSKRWHNIQLKDEVEKQLGENFWNEFGEKPRGLLWRQLLSPDNGFSFFYQCARFIGAEPLAFEFIGDLYMSFNEEKKGLGQIKITTKEGEPALVNVMDLHKWNKKPLSEIVLKTGESLVDFHHSLVKYSQYDIEIKDMTSWVRGKGKPSEWYYYYLLHFVAHGVLFDAYLAEEDEKSKAFFSETVLPNLERIKSIFGVDPILIKHYPDNQTEEEDFYWWNYPPSLNSHLLEYAQKNQLKVNKLNEYSK